jgi:hypothetical protein
LGRGNTDDRGNRFVELRILGAGLIALILRLRGYGGETKREQYTDSREGGLHFESPDGE